MIAHCRYVKKKNTRISERCKRNMVEWMNGQEM